MKKSRKEDLNSALEALDSLEQRKVSSGSASTPERVLIGTVDRFFDHINVAAINLTGRLSVGDTIEIENDEYTIRQRVSSMQINRRDVESATAGDDVGVKISVPVRRGSSVFRIQ